MDAGFEAHLRVGGATFDRRDAALLRAIDEHRSLSRAAEALGRSYSRAHERVTDLEAAIGPLVERRRGGAGGGGSELTSAARELLSRYDRLQVAMERTATAEEVVLEGRVVDRDGELVTVETSAGRVRALSVDDAEAVQVVFRADAVTLHGPETAPPAVGTSARNRFRGTVVGVERSEAVARVTVEVEGGLRLRVTITTESLETLDLDEGAPVIATFKATATRATAAE